MTIYVLAGTAFGALLIYWFHPAIALKRRRLIKLNDQNFVSMQEFRVPLEHLVTRADYDPRLEKYAVDGYVSFVKWGYSPNTVGNTLATGVWNLIPSAFATPEKCEEAQKFQIHVGYMEKI